MHSLLLAQISRPLRRRIVALATIAGLALIAPGVACADTSSTATSAPVTAAVVSPDAGSWSSPASTTPTTTDTTSTDGTTSPDSSSTDDSSTDAIPATGNAGVVSDDAGSWS